MIRAAVKTVAAYLGNTPTVCRASYIDPRLFDRYRARVTTAPALGALKRAPDLSRPGVRRSVESAVLDLLAEERIG